MWFLLISLLLIITVCGIVYLSFRSAHFPFIRHAAGERLWLSRLLCLLLYSAMTAVLWKLWGMMNALVCLVHLLVFWIIFELIFLLLRKRVQNRLRSNAAGYAAWIFCIVYLIFGWIAEHDVRATAYHLESDKLSEEVRIVQITDAHMGATFHADGFARYMEEINALSPDAVVVTGDFIDDDTSAEDLLGACQTLGTLKTTYGVFFVYGNHDLGYAAETNRDWNDAMLRTALSDHGVRVLEDEAVLLGDNFYLVGRKDHSVIHRGGMRKTAEELMDGLDQNKYIIFLNHQPDDFEAEAAAGADLVLCGHTHGGQFLPIHYMGQWTGEYCLRYGHEKRDNTDFIVSSGISNWALKFKTGCVSEYVVIELG